MADSMQEWLDGHETPTRVTYADYEPPKRRVSVVGLVLAICVSAGVFLTLEGVSLAWLASHNHTFFVLVLAVIMGSLIFAAMFLAGFFARQQVISRRLDND